MYTVFFKVNQITRNKPLNILRVIWFTLTFSLLISDLTFDTNLLKLQKPQIQKPATKSNKSRHNLLLNILSTYCEFASLLAGFQLSRSLRLLKGWCQRRFLNVWLILFKYFV